MSDEVIFVDTNVMVYAYDADAGIKHQTAQSYLKELWQTGQGVLSIQVLQEFYVTLTRKLSKPLSGLAARELIQTYAAWEVYSPTATDVVAAAELAEHHRLSFWDAMIIVAAQMSGATKLFSEDLQNDRLMGGLTVTNPFV